MEALRRHPPWTGLGWALLGGMVCALVAPLEPNLLEEGIALHLAERMAAGETLFTQLGSFTGPLPFEVLAAAFRIFGTTVWVPRGMVVALHAGATAASWGIGRRAAGQPGGHAAAVIVAATPVLLFPYFSLYFYTTLAVLLTWVACHAAVRSVSSLRWALAAGLLVACIALSKQTLGVALALTFLASTWACARREERLRLSLGFIQGGALAAIATCAYYAWTGQLAAMYYWIVEVPLAIPERFGSPYMNLWPIGEFSEAVRSIKVLYIPWLFSSTANPFVDELPRWLVVTTQVAHSFPLLSIALTLLLRLRGPLPAALWVHFAALVALLTNLYPRADWGHLALVLPSACVQLALVALHAARSLPVRARAVAVGTLGVVVLLGTVASLLRIQEFTGPANMGPRVPLRPVSHMARGDAVGRVISYIRERTEPGDPIFVARGEPMIYFATETTNPTRFGYMLPGHPELQEDEILEALEEVDLVVMSDVDQPAFNYYRDELPRIQEYLERYFDVPKAFHEWSSDWIVVLERVPDRGATALDLFELGDRGTRWVRDSAGAVTSSHEPTNKVSVRQNRRPLSFWVEEGGGGIDFTIAVPPEDAVFQASVGYPYLITNVDFYDHAAQARMEVSIDEGGGFVRILSQRVRRPRQMRGQSWFRPTDRGKRWIPIEVDLAPYAGREVTLRMELVPERELSLPGQGWFGSPRIALRSPSDPADAAAK